MPPVRQNAADTRSQGNSISAYSQNARTQKQERLKSLQLLPEARAVEDKLALSKLPTRFTESLEPTPSGFPPRELVFLCRSMWNLRSRHLTTYTSVPFYWNAERLIVQHGEDIIPRERTPEQLLSLDIAYLKHTIKILRRLVKRKIPVLLMCTIHSETLSDQKRFARFAATAELVPAKFRKKIVYDVVGLDDHCYGVESVRLVKRLAPYSRAVTATINLHDRNFRFWKHCGFVGVGVDVSRDHRTEESIISDLDDFAAQAKDRKLLTYLREVDKYSLTIAAVSAGFDFVEGAAVGSIDDREDPRLSEFNVENLFYEDATDIEWLNR